jgi:magnesium-transporting ATPase (P-type)
MSLKNINKGILLDSISALFILTISTSFVFSLENLGSMDSLGFPYVIAMNIAIFLFIVTFYHLLLRKSGPIATYARRTWSIGGFMAFYAFFSLLGGSLLGFLLIYPAVFLSVLVGNVPVLVNSTVELTIIFAWLASLFSAAVWAGLLSFVLFCIAYVKRLNSID